MIKYFLSIGALICGMQSAWGFSLAGPVGNGGDSWQTAEIGYGPPRELPVGPKNIGEEYRRNIPLMYYAYDANFLDFFGLAGTTNVDAAFAQMNGVLNGQTNTPLYLPAPTNNTLANILGPTTNLDNYSVGLSEFPLDSQQFNYQAQALGLADLKSVTLYLLVQQMGLVSPETYVWTLHDRYLPPGLSCPRDEEYLVVQRNFDITASPLNQIQYSSYVNETLYTYYIEQFCPPAPNPLAFTVPYPVDFFADAYTSVAGGLDQLYLGGFYTGLTRDDVAGLRYLMTAGNINFENAGAGALLSVTNISPSQLLQTLPLSLLSSQTLLNLSPTNLQTLFPNLNIASYTSNYVNVAVSNVVAYFTNLPPPYTNQAGGAFPAWTPVQYASNQVLITTLPFGPFLSLVQTTDPATLEGLYPGLIISSVITNYYAVQIQTNISFYYTNQPGPSLTNYQAAPGVLWTNYDLSLFSSLASTSSPAVLQALYPALDIVSSVGYYTNLITPNVIQYLTNQVGSIAGSPAYPVTVTNGYNFNIVEYYNYVFGNIVTNTFSTKQQVTIQDIWETNQVGSVAGSPLKTNTSTTVVTYTNTASGDFFIVPTNWCGYQILITNLLPNYLQPFPSYTNTVTGVITNNYGVLQYTFNDIVYYTNRIAAVEVGTCEPLLEYSTNYTTNTPIFYQYTFLNIITNAYYTNSSYTLIITNIGPTNGGTVGMLFTNVTTNHIVVTNQPSGDFFIVPATWCGYQQVDLLTNVFQTVNTVTATNLGTNGSFYSVTTISLNTNQTLAVRPGTCVPALAFVTNYSASVPVLQYHYNFGNVVINPTSFSSNSSETIITTNLEAVTNGLLGQLTNSVTTTNVVQTNVVSGDFFIIPPNWCGYTILATQLVTTVYSTNVFTATNLPGINDIGQQYTVTTISSYSNYTFLVQPEICTLQAPAAALREGIERAQFIRANYDSLVGQFFQPITNTYTMVKVTNSQQVLEYYQRVITAPDFLFSATDQASPNTAQIGANIWTITTPNFDQGNVLPGLAGPGVINPRTTITFDKVGDVFFNGSLNLLGISTNAFLEQGDQGSVLGLTNADGLSIIAYGSFDGSTNDPVVYPSGTSIQDLENSILIQITPPILPDGTNGIAYPPTTFSATGGQPAYTWAISSGSLPAGLTLSGATISGTPNTPAGTYDFVLQLTDSVNRVVNLGYSITIH